MVHIKVVKGSKLLLIASIVIFGLVVGIILFSMFKEKEPSATQTQTNLVAAQENVEAKTDMVFASLDGAPSLSLFDPALEQVSVEIITPDVNKPSVLIYHTHTHEAYEQVANDRYVAIEAWRTLDQDHSVVRVGEELANQLQGHGFEVIHDITDHEQNDLGTAYTRSLDTLLSYDRPFDLYIDIHRDAYIEGVHRDHISEDGQSMAQLMLLIGNGEGFSEKPYYKENLLFAQRLTERINEQEYGLCKDVLVKDGRYNQHVGVFSILVEVGHNRNTLEEALSALPYLAEGISSLLIERPDATLQALMQ